MVATNWAGGRGKVIWVATTASYNGIRGYCNQGRHITRRWSKMFCGCSLSTTTPAKDNPVGTNVYQATHVLSRHRSTRTGHSRGTPGDGLRHNRVIHLIICYRDEVKQFPQVCSDLRNRKDRVGQPIVDTIQAVYEQTSVAGMSLAASVADKRCWMQSDIEWTSGRSLSMALRHLEDEEVDRGSLLEKPL